MNTENEHSYFICEVISESAKAWLVRIDRTSAEHWVPKSLCGINRGLNGGLVLEVEEWFAKKEGLGDD